MSELTTDAAQAAAAAKAEVATVKVAAAAEATTLVQKALAFVKTNQEAFYGFGTGFVAAKLGVFGFIASHL